ncbi:MAG: hypothetical protein SPF89_10605 [Sphaerochaetaceae bacterium]|nr:hypothetical protein [Spirochaetales bacterium]MDY5500544.1 hypothetical protein [Sphaerochaetaceae bacterium]
MKRFLLVSLIGIAIALPLSAKTLRGTIKVFGTEPKTSLGIETSDGKRYGIITGTILREELFNQQGVPLKLKGKKQKKGQNPQTDLEDGSFYVKSYMVIK